MRRRSFLDLGLKCSAATGFAQFWAMKALALRATKYSLFNLLNIEPIRLGNQGFHLAAFFDGHGRCAAQSGIFARQFLVAESAVNLL